jgi:hypothetical protein
MPVPAGQTQPVRTQTTRTMPATTMTEFSSAGVYIINDVKRTCPSAGPPPYPCVPPGFPGAAYVEALGYYFVPMIENSTQFRALSHGVQFHIEPYSSFGYDVNGNDNTSETVLLFSPGNSTYILTEVSVQSGNITAMYEGSSMSYGFGPTPIHTQARSSATPLQPWAVPLITATLGAAIFAIMTYSLNRARDKPENIPTD